MSIKQKIIKYMLPLVLASALQGCDYSPPKVIQRTTTEGYNVTITLPDKDQTNYAYHKIRVTDGKTNVFGVDLTGDGRIDEVRMTQADQVSPAKERSELEKYACVHELESLLYQKY